MIANLYWHCFHWHEMAIVNLRPQLISGSSKWHNLCIINAWLYNGILLGVTQLRSFCIFTNHCIVTFVWVWALVWAIARFYCYNKKQKNWGLIKLRIVCLKSIFKLIVVQEVIFLLAKLFLLRCEVQLNFLFYIKVK